MFEFREKAQHVKGRIKRGYRKVLLDIRCIDYWKRIWVEFIGTLLFLFIAIGTAQSSSALVQSEPGNSQAAVLSIALAFGITITTLVYGLGHISGHFNPAVTLALFVSAEFNFFTGVLYIVAQCLGGLVGVGLLRALVNNNLWNEFAVNKPKNGISSVQALFLECIATSLLVIVVLGITVDPRGNVPNGKSRIIGAIPIGFAVFVANIFLIPFTNAGINPARSFASACVAGDFEYHWLFWVGPFLGSLLGALVYKIAMISPHPLYVQPEILIEEEDVKSDDVEIDVSSGRSGQARAA